MKSLLCALVLGLMVCVGCGVETEHKTTRTPPKYGIGDKVIVNSQLGVVVGKPSFGETSLTWIYPTQFRDTRIDVLEDSILAARQMEWSMKSELKSELENELPKLRIEGVPNLIPPVPFKLQSNKTTDDLPAFQPTLRLLMENKWVLLA